MPSLDILVSSTPWPRFAKDIIGTIELRKLAG
jgi:hypothetical protein